MKIKKYEIDFSHNRKALTASVQEIEGAYKTPLIRASVRFPDRKRETVFIFWRLDSGDLFYHNYSGLDVELTGKMKKLIMARSAVKDPAVKKKTVSKK